MPPGTDRARLELESGAGVLLLETGDALLLESAIITTYSVRIAFTTAPFADTPTWTDVTNDVQEIHIRRGRKNELDRLEAGTATIVLENSSGDYWPDNTGGTYTPNIRTMKKVSIRGSLDEGANWIDMYTGYVEEWRPFFRGSAGKAPCMTVSCVDAIRALSRHLITNAGYASELSGTRVGNVLDTFGFPAADRAIDTGQETLQATGALTNENAMSHLQTLQETELSLFYIGANGYAVYEDRHHRAASPHDVSLGIFGDDPTELPYTSIDFSMDETLLYNDIRFTRTGGSQQTGEDTTSQTNYGKRSLAKSGLFNNTDVSVDVICDYFAARYGDVDHSRVKFVGITPDCDLINLTTHCLNREISDRITIRLDQSGIDNDFYIEGISHDVVFIGANAWMLQTKWNLSDATRWLYTPIARTQTLLPNASGDETNINSKTGATNWESVINVSTSTYVANTDNETTFDRDFYNLAAAGYPSGVISKITVRGDFLADPNAKTVQGAVKLCVKSGATIDESGESVVSTATYETVTQDWTTDPNTGAAWTWAAIDALQVGPSIKRATPFGGSTNWTRCKYILVTVSYTPAW